MKNPDFFEKAKDMFASTLSVIFGGYVKYDG